MAEVRFANARRSCVNPFLNLASRQPPTIGKELDALAKGRPADLMRKREERFLAIGG